MIKIIISIVILVLLIYIVYQYNKVNLRKKSKKNQIDIDEFIDNQRKENADEVERLKNKLLNLKLKEESIKDKNVEENTTSQQKSDIEDEEALLELEKVRLREELKKSLDSEYNEDIKKLEKLHKDGYFKDDKVYYLVKNLVETEYIKRPRVLRSWSFEELVRLHEFNDMKFKIEMTVDFHRLNKDSAYYFLNKIVKYSKGRLVVLTIIHGFNHGTVLREMIWKDFKNIKIQDKHLHNNNVGRTTLLIEP